MYLAYTTGESWWKDWRRSLYSPERVLTEWRKPPSGWSSQKFRSSVMKNWPLTKFHHLFYLRGKATRLTPSFPLCYTLLDSLFCLKIYVLCRFSKWPFVKCLEIREPHRRRRSLTCRTARLAAHSHNPILIRIMIGCKNKVTNMKYSEILVHKIISTQKCVYYTRFKF